MNLLLAFMFGVICFTIWELRGGPRWRMWWVVPGCAVLALAFTMERLV